MTATSTDSAANAPVGPVLYVASRFPAVSETFVWREVEALRHAGVAVEVATLRSPTSGAHEDELIRRLGRPIQVYGAGLAEMLVGAFAESLRHPLRALRTSALGARDAVLSDDLKLRARFVLPLQVAAALATARRARRLGVRHVHAHMANAPTTVAMYLASQLAVPFSFTGHANDLFVDRSLLGQKLRRAAFVACISEWHRALYRSIVPLPDARAPIVRCGVDVVPPSAAPAAIVPRVVGVGRLVPKKGFHVLLEALRFVQEHGRKLSVVIVGDGPERERLEARAKSLPEPSAVRFAGALAHAAVLELVRNCDVFVLPCVVDEESGDKDGIPVALMEAMAAGRAVVAGDLPAIRELVDDAVTGRTVAPGDAAALASTMEQLLDDAPSRARLGAAARERVVREFATNVNVARLVRAFSGTSSAAAVRDASGVGRADGAMTRGA